MFAMQGHKYKEPKTWRDGFRDLGLLMEDMHIDIKAIAKQHGDIKKTQNEHSHKHDQNTEMIGELKTDVTILKEDVSELKEDVSILKEDVSELKEDMQEVKSGLKQKVDKKDFADLKSQVLIPEV